MGLHSLLLLQYRSCLPRFQTHSCVSTIVFLNELTSNEFSSHTTDSNVEVIITWPSYFTRALFMMKSVVVLLFVTNMLTTLGYELFNKESSFLWDKLVILFYFCCFACYATNLTWFSTPIQFPWFNQISNIWSSHWWSWDRNDIRLQPWLWRRRLRCTWVISYFLWWIHRTTHVIPCPALCFNCFLTLH